MLTVHIPSSASDNKGNQQTLPYKTTICGVRGGDQTKTHLQTQIQKTRFFLLNTFDLK